MIILYANCQYLATVVVEAKRIKEATISALALCYTNSYPTRKHSHVSTSKQLNTGLPLYDYPRYRKVFVSERQKNTIPPEVWAVTLHGHVPMMCYAP